MYHLRQRNILSIEDQENYFLHEIPKMFHEEKPKQILFSFLENNTCIGYGGLVHINWINKNAEISFLMDTELEKERFTEIWSVFLELIECVAFEHLDFLKIYTYAFEFRRQLFEVLLRVGFELDNELKAKSATDKAKVIIHSKKIRSL